MSNPCYISRCPAGGSKLICQSIITVDEEEDGTGSVSGNMAAPCTDTFRANVTLTQNHKGCYCPHWPFGNIVFQAENTVRISMWSNGTTAVASLRIFQHLQHCCVQSLRRSKAERWQRRFGTSSSGPPWRLLFFGSDEFAVESLKLLSSSRCEAYCKQINLHCTEFYIILCWNVKWGKNTTYCLFRQSSCLCQILTNHGFLKLWRMFVIMAVKKSCFCEVTLFKD